MEIHVKDNLLIGTKRIEKHELQDIYCYNGLTGRLRKNEKYLRTRLLPRRSTG